MRPKARPTDYDQRKANLQSEDLKRYGIQTVWVYDYAQVPLLLCALEAYVTRRSVMVSGAALDPAPLGSERLDELSRALGAEIIRRGFNLVSGFGVGIAEQAILGAFRAVYESRQSLPAERVFIRPFPGGMPLAHQPAAFTRHRELLISQVGALIVVAGNKDDGKGVPIPSSGVEEEVQIALRLGKPVIPIGATGHVAQQVWQAATAEPERYLPGIKCDDQLPCLGNDRASVADLIAAVAVLVERAEKRAVIGF